MNKDDDSAENFLDREDVQEVVLSVCGILFDFGFREIHIGGLMRLVGVDEEKAREHDDEVMILDQEFEDTYLAYVESLDRSEDSDTVDIKRPPHVTLH